jgi:hypothetical protein
VARTKFETQAVRSPGSGRIEVAVYERDATDESGHSVFVWLSRKEARRLRKQLTEALTK